MKGKAGRHEKTGLELSGQIKEIFGEHRGRYGSPRVWEELKGRGWRAGRKRIERLMKAMGLKAGRRRKRVKTADSGHKPAAAENILKRDFRAGYPGEKRVPDITCLRTGSGWPYLAVILDLWDRKVIGWSMPEELTAEPVSRALAMAAGSRPPREGLIFHSDRGVQYCSEEFRSTLYRLCPSARQSMSRKGNCWDNACAESFFSALKAELEELERRRGKKQI